MAIDKQLFPAFQFRRGDRVERYVFRARQMPGCKFSGSPNIDDARIGRFELPFRRGGKGIFEQRRKNHHKSSSNALFGRAPAAESLSHALRRRFALFSPDSHKRILRQKREAAALVMARCADFGVTLRLIGHVLEGSATAHSAVELVVVSLASGEALDDKSVSLALLNAGFDPELFETPYPTAYARRLSGGSRRAGRRRLATLLIHAADEPVLIRIPLVPAPLPKAVCPDDYQSEAEVAGAADLEALQRLLAQTPADADRSETGGECVPKGLPLSHSREAR